MKKQNNKPEEAALLRQKAEELLQRKDKACLVSTSATEPDLLKLIHELQVHQIELELQNEELILAHDQAKAATEKYVELYDFAPSGYFTLSREGKIIGLNLQGARMLGKERALLINSRFGSFIKEDSRSAFTAFLEEIFQGKSLVNCDLPLVFNGNNHLHVHLSGIMSDMKELCRITAIDITERKKAEDDLKKNLAKYQVLINTFPIAVTISDKAGNIVETNEKALELLGLSRDEHLKRKLKGEEWKIIKTDGTLFPQDEYASVKALKENRLVENVEMGIVKSDNEITWINVTAAPIPIEDLGVVITYNDISERKLLEERIQKTQERFKALVDVSLTGIWTADPFGNNTYVSPQWSQITGISPENAKGDGWSFGLHPDDRERIMNDWKLNGPNEKPKTYNFRFIRPDGSIVWVLSQATVVKDSDGKIIEWIGNLTDINELKQAEEELRTSKQLLEEIINNAPVRIFWKDRNLVYQGCNIEFAKDAGFPNPDDIIGKDDYQMGWHQQAELYRSDDREVIESGKSKLNIEEPQTTPDGKIITILTNKIPLRNAKGEVEGVLGIFLDITPRKQMENALRENEERLRLALKATNDVVWDWDIVNDSQRWNEAGMKVFGWTEIVENTVNAAWWVDRIHTDDRQRVEKGFYAVVNNSSGNNWQDEYRFRKADGTYAEVLDRAYVLRDNQGKAIRMIGAMLDITEPKRAEKALRESELFANTIANTTPALLYLYDFEQAKNIWTNEVHKRFFEEMNKDASGFQFTDIVQLIHPDDLDSAIAHYSELVDAHSVARFNTELRIKWRDSWKWMKHFVTVFKTNDIGKPVQILGAIFDIDEQKKTEHDLLEAKEKAEESDRLKSAFLANMSHEIRTPMNGILGFAELLKEPDLSGEQQSEYLSIIEKSGARMLNTINDIVDFSKIEAGLVEVNVLETNINFQINDIYRFFKPEAEARGLKISFNKSLPDDEVNIATDAEKLHAILTNLVKNAIKYTPKGFIEFGYKKTDSEPCQLEFFVKDTGIGIPQDRLEAIFERFVQADIYDKRALEGSGLGLSISKAYVEMLGGKIWVESREEDISNNGNGFSAFYFTIPFVRFQEQGVNTENEVIETESQPEPYFEGSGLKILIVEDEEISDSVLTIALKDFSNEILHAATGIEAVETCRLHPDIDLILMDIKMPGIDGLETTRQIREFNKKVVIIAQTAYALRGDKTKTLEAGCNDYISKPIIKSELLRLLQKNLK